MRLLWFVSTLEDTNFLKAFNSCFDGNIDVFNINYITRFDLRGHNGKHLMPFYKRVKDNPVKDDLTMVFNVLSERLSLEEATKAYLATNTNLEQYIEKSGKNFVMVIPSGRHVHHIAATRLAKQEGIKRIYINYSNFPGYTFFDPEGTDCLASIFYDPERLNSMFNDASVNIEAVFNHFSALKNQQKSIPQLASSGFKKRAKAFAFILDTVLQKITCMYGDRRIKLGGAKPDDSRNPISYKVIKTLKPFLFFPLQVSTDQQVLINYEGGSIYAAIDQAIKYAQTLSLPLYVREHPAESNKSAVRAYLAIQQEKYDFFHVTQASVSELIKGCDQVITINSTVGLESRINRKSVKFLGKSFYEKATDEQLALYLDKYLISVDYHNPLFSKDKVALMLERYRGN